MLYISFWKISLTNFPGESFIKRLIPVDEAAALVSAARADDTLRCVSSRDLLAPYEQRAYRDHAELCVALSTRGIVLTVDDFVGESCCNPLEFARVSRGNRLLVVDCNFTFNADSIHRTRGADKTLADPPEQVVERVSRLFRINAESVACYLFEEAVT